MSHPVHLTFRRGEPITLEAIYRASRELVRNRVPQLGDNYGDGRYWVMQVYPEHEYALQSAEMRDYYQPLMKQANPKPVLPDEIGSIMGFRVVAGW